MERRTILIKGSTRGMGYGLSRKLTEEEIQVGILRPGRVRTDFLLRAMDTLKEAEKEGNRKVFDILAEEVEVVAEFLVSMLPKVLKLMM